MIDQFISHTLPDILKTVNISVNRNKQWMDGS